MVYCSDVRHEEHVSAAESDSKWYYSGGVIPYDMICDNDYVSAGPIIPWSCRVYAMGLNVRVIV